MKQFVMNAEPQLIKEVDYLVKKEKLYSSRNEFIRDAIRTRVLEYRRMMIRRMLKSAAKNAIRKGWNGKMPSKAKMDKITKEFIKSKEGD